MTDEVTTNEEDEMVVAMRATVILGGEPRVFKVKTIAETIDFRVKAGELFGAVYGPLVSGRGDQSPESIAAVTEKMMPNLMGKGFDRFLGLTVAYAPELKEYIDGATEDEMIDAATEVLRIALPLLEKVLNRIAKIRAMLTKAGVSL